VIIEPAVRSVGITNAATVFCTLFG
jgi:hypothetical protein